jgi:hypothetical protein
VRFVPSLPHDGLVLLFRNRPELAPELLRDVLGVALPTYAEARIESAELTEVMPTEYRADLVVLLVDGKPVLGIIVEVQLELKKDDRKFFTWPAYVANLRARLECPTCVLVIAPSESIAERARAPIALGPGSTVTPFVVGPKAVPVIRDREVAKRDPELAVLSAMAHGQDEPELAIQIATAALTGAAGLDSERALLYSDLVRISLSEAARIAFEDLMATGNYEYQSEFARKHHARGEASAVLRVLAKRRIELTEEQKRRILECTDLALLDRWIDDAVTIASADELFTS